ncbi:MAG: heavy metal translocating P-type ATPase [Fusobacteriaceae bacterium]
METLIFKLDGFSCAGCLPKIEKAIGEIEGIDSCHINFNSSKMTVVGKELDEKKIINIFLKYEPHVKIKILMEESDEQESNEESKNEKLQKFIILAGIILYFFTIFLAKEKYSILLYLISYLIIGNKVLKTAFLNLRRGMVLDENFLMTVATFGAFAIGEYSEAVAVMLFYLIGETLQDYAVDKSRRAISEAMDIVPEKANLKIGEEIRVVSPKSLQVGDILIVRAGEKIPVDSIVLSGSSSLNTSALTGESKPQDVSVGDSVLSGAINLNGILEIKVIKTYKNSTVSKILEYVEKASERKANIEKFMTKFSKYYTPAVVGISTFVFLIPGFYTGDFKIWLYRALLFLVISCPCALVVSIPLGVFSGIGKSSKEGILVKGGNYLETLGKIGAVVFDKTGTLTKGEFLVLKDTVPKEIGEIVLAIESNSTHPVAKSIVKHYGKSSYIIFDSYIEEHGYGISANYLGVEYLVGNKKLMEKHNIEIEEFSDLGTAVYVAVSQQFIGGYSIGDTLRENSKDLIKFLNENGIKSYMLSGDKKENAYLVGEELGIDKDKVFGELLPNEKMDMYEKIKKSTNKKVAFVGDGINDAPVLRLSDVGISLGGTGSDAALEAADVVIMDNNIGKLKTGIEISKNVERILIQNVIFSLGIKIIVMILGVLGYADMWLAVFADVGVAILAVLNAIRILKKSNKKRTTE